MAVRAESHNRAEVLVRQAQPDEQEDERVDQESDKLPDRLDRLAPLVRKGSQRPRVADQQARRQARQYARQVEMFGQQERAVGGDGREGDFQQVIVRAARQQQDRACDKQPT